MQFLILKKRVAASNFSDAIEEVQVANKNLTEKLDERLEDLIKKYQEIGQKIEVTNQNITTIKREHGNPSASGEDELILTVGGSEHCVKRKELTQIPGTKLSLLFSGDVDRLLKDSKGRIIIYAPSKHEKSLPHHLSERYSAEHDRDSVSDNHLFRALDSPNALSVQYSLHKFGFEVPTANKNLRLAEACDAPERDQDEQVTQDQKTVFPQQHEAALDKMEEIINAYGRELSCRQNLLRRMENQVKELQRCNNDQVYQLKAQNNFTITTHQSTLEPILANLPVPTEADSTWIDFLFCRTTDKVIKVDESEYCVDKIHELLHVVKPRDNGDTSKKTNLSVDLLMQDKFGALVKKWFSAPDEYLARIKYSSRNKRV